MGKINSRAKGCRGELEWAKVLREHGYADARRGQQHAGGPDSPDVVGGIPGTHCEAKRVETFSDAKLREWLGKATEEAPAGSFPYVAHRKNRQPWRVTLWLNPIDDGPRVPVTMLAEDFFTLFETT